MKNAHKLILAAAGMAVLTGCGQSAVPVAPVADCKGMPDAAEVSELKTKIAKLEAENTELRQTPAALLEIVKSQTAAGNVALADQALESLKARHPGTREFVLAEKEMAALAARQAAAKVEEERRRTLGFKALGQKSLIDATEVKVAVESVGLAGRWVFDDHGHEYSYREASRGSKYLVAKVTVTTKGASNPDLPGMAVYAQSGDALERVGTGAYQFTRWMDYGSYLGNGHDFRNDFNHSSKIPFSIGVEIADYDLKKPAYLVAHTQGCFSRTEERFGRPPVAYRDGCSALLPAKLTLPDFADGKLVIVKTLGSTGK